MDHKCLAQSASPRQRAHADNGNPSSFAHPRQHRAYFFSCFGQSNCTIHIGAETGISRHDDLRDTRRCSTWGFVLGGGQSGRRARAHPNSGATCGSEELNWCLTKGGHDRNSPTCTLSQSGYAACRDSVIGRMPPSSPIK